MAEKMKFHFIAETSLGHIDGDLKLKVKGNDVEGTFDALGVEMHLIDGHYANNHFSGKFEEEILFTPVSGTIEGDIDGDKCTATITTASGSRTIESV